MDRDAAAALLDIYERALAVLVEAEAHLFAQARSAERGARIRAYGEVVADLQMKLRGPLVQQFPELDRADDLGSPDDTLDEDERAEVAHLTAAQVSAIDAALLSHCVRSARKVAFIVGSVFTTEASGLADVPVAYLVKRVQALVADGRLLSAGNLAYMRYSEVWLPEAR